MQKRVMKTAVRSREGFTLIEALLVILIIGAIAAMVVPQLVGKQQQALKDQTKNNIAGLESALKIYAIDHNGSFPTGGQEILNELTAPSEFNGKKLSAYLDKSPKDAWGQELFYEFPTSKVGNDRPAIWSSGQNLQNEDGAGDDVNNWTES